MSKASRAAASAKLLPDSEYITLNISDEAVREVELLGTGASYRIPNPKTLILRRGGLTHRVIDAEGVVHCYAAPETGKSVVRWIPRDPANPVRF